MGVPEEEDGESGADEVCYDGEDWRRSVIAPVHPLLTDTIEVGSLGPGEDSPP